MKGGNPRSASSANSTLGGKRAQPPSSPAAHSTASTRTALVAGRTGEPEAKPKALAVAATEPTPLVSVVIVSHDVREPLRVASVRQRPSES